MQEFDLPLLDAIAAPGDAFPRMLDAGTSGIAIKVGADVRLLKFDLLVDAVGRGTRQLRDIKGFEDTAALALDVTRDAYSRALKDAGRRYGVIEIRETARLVSVRESYADVYLTSPPVSKCRNVKTPHYYPPHKRDPRRPKRCGVCGFDLP